MLKGFSYVFLLLYAKSQWMQLIYLFQKVMVKKTPQNNLNANTEITFTYMTSDLQTAQQLAHISYFTS